MSTTFSSPVALIVGGARMGEAVSLALASLGYRLVLSYRHSRRLCEQTIRTLRARGGEAVPLRLDLSREADIHRAMARLGRRFGRLDVIVNLASTYEKTPLRWRPGRAWDAALQSNARGGYLLTIAAAPWLRQSPRARVIHVADWTAASARPRYRGYAPYYVSKAAVKAIVETLALELAPGILVNGIAPGPILPPRGISAAEKQSVEKATPLARWGGAQEIAKAVDFLVRTDFVTGETIRVDGGRHLL